MFHEKVSGKRLTRQEKITDKMQRWEEMESNVQT